MTMRIRALASTLGFLLAAIPGVADTRLIFPRVVFQRGLFSGMAISNPTGASATIKLTAYNLDGTKLAAAGTQNEVVPPDLPSGGQYLKLASQVFDPDSVLVGPSPKYYWVEVTSATTGLAGFYIEGDSNITFQYGGDLGTFGTDLYLPAVENSGTTVTEISLVNADSSSYGGDANVTVDFLRADGSQVGSRDVVIAKAASLQGPLAGISAFNVQLDQVAALRVRSDRPVLCYGIVRPQSGRTPVALPAEDVTTPAKTLYFPQLADGGGWTTSIGISNLNFSATALVNITAYDKNGSVFVDPTITNPKSVTIPAGGFMRSSFKDLFPFTDGSYKEGWLKVEAAGTPSINGFVEYGSGNNRALVIAQLNPYQLSMFSHQAQGAPYFTGLAVLNPGSLAANVEIFSLDGLGKTWGRVQTVLKPGQRTSQLLYQLVSESSDKTGGSVFVRSDRPVFATELFAKNDVSALANVPPQQVTASFDPKSTLPRITPVPPLAVIETGKTKQFTATGISGGVQWFVNGTKGNAAIGTITDAGLYTAPTKAPAPRTLTIQASAAGGNNSGASSIDVVQREQLTGGLTLVTAVAYLDSLQRFFVAEQQLVSSAPVTGVAAASANTQIYEVVKSDSGTANAPFLSVSGDTVAKMLPYDDGGSHYMLLAGRDSGKVYLLDVAAKTLKTVASGLSQPNSIALDPTTGNLLVAESGAGQITIITPAQIAAASEPASVISAPGGIPSYQAVAVPNIRGVAVDKCTGTVYVTLSTGELHEYQGASRRVVETGLDNPTQLLATYREGFSCATALTLGIVETNRVSLSYPKTELPRATLIDNTPGISDITFFPKGNPFTGGGEASLAVAQGSSVAKQGQVTNIGLGGAYQSVPPLEFTRGGLYGGTGPNEDPIGDTFDADELAQLGLSVADIVSVTGSTQGGQSVITLKFAAPVTLGSLPTGETLSDGLWAFIYLKTTAGSAVLSQFPVPLTVNLPDYFPFGNPGVFTFDSFLGVFYGEGTYSSVTGLAAPVKVSAIGNTLTLSVPASVLDLSGATAVVMVGPSGIFTDVAPNNGVLRLAP
jgi:hypothetical protein